MRLNSSEPFQVASNRTDGSFDYIKGESDRVSEDVVFLTRFLGGGGVPTLTIVVSNDGKLLEARQVWSPWLNQTYRLGNQLILLDQ